MRRLSPDEIEDIITQIPPPPIPSSELREKVSQEVRTSVYLQLRSQEIYPSLIPKLKNYVANHASKSFLPPGTHVGMNTGESTGQPATQLTLDAFHQSGQTTKKGGFARFKSKVGLSKDPLGSSTLIHFMDLNLSYEEAFLQGKRFVSVKINDLLQKPVEDRVFSLMTTDSANRDWYPDFEEVNPDYMSDNLNEYEGFFARLTFNKEKLILYNLTLQDIVTEMMENDIKKGKESRNIGDFITCFCGPLTEGIIDVYPNVDAIESAFKFFNSSNSREESIDFNISRFFRETFEGFLTATRIGKYSNVSDSNVKMYKTTELIQGVEQDPDLLDKIRIWINPIIEKTTGIPISKLILLLQLLGFTTYDDNLNLDIESFDLGWLLVDNVYMIRDPKSSTGFRQMPTPNNTDDFLAVIDNFVKVSENSMIDQYENHTDPTLPQLMTNDIYRYSHYCIVTTLGTNFREIRTHPDVDAYRTFSDDPQQIYDVLGIEALRNYLEREIYELFKSNDLIIAPRNITVMVDWMTSNFRPTSINSKSVGKQGRGIFAQACFENPIDAIRTGAVFGPIEKVTNTSTSILFGTKINSGTGAFDVEPDPEIVEMYRNFKSVNEPGAARLTSNTLSQLTGLAGKVTQGIQRAGVISTPVVPEKPLGPIQASGRLPGASVIDDLFGISDKPMSLNDSESDEDSFNPDDIPSTVSDNDAGRVRFGEI